MGVKLKVIHGALRRNNRFQVVVPITKTPFVIGRSSDCDMLCYSQAVSDHHCEIRVMGHDVIVASLDHNGVNVNGTTVHGERRLVNGDRLAFGRLEFELIVEVPQSRSGTDPWDSAICDMLLESDRLDAEQRDSDSRWYRIEPVDPYEGMSARERVQAKARKKIPKPNRPRKLPKRVADSPEAAVDEALAKMAKGIEQFYRLR
jgi:pSer/pThr/pTyr-binding forkhead associated (FHA) protein